ncbi:MAG: hypothetical protein KGL43_24735 [Burkholderiales bacterium]|nr:hypothetical protein [Burkholderiales bacterium]MDE2398855.1 hypothetical protein [Burkholderiales bacterium]MDE2456808.1 hypothetical protein [Burkholderiales bacterium]
MSWSERRVALGALWALALGGCGFELRQTQPMPFQTIALAGFGARSELAAELRRSLEGRARVVETPAQAQVVLTALADERGESVVASTSAAQVREFQLRLKFGFRVSTPGGRELTGPVELALTRDLTYSENLALAKEEEQADLYREMRADIVSQVTRRLAALRL